jgi:hypothetical protein
MRFLTARYPASMCILTAWYSACLCVLPVCVCSDCMVSWQHDVLLACILAACVLTMKCPDSMCVLTAWRSAPLCVRSCVLTSWCPVSTVCVFWLHGILPACVFSLHVSYLPVCVSVLFIHINLWGLPACLVRTCGFPACTFVVYACVVYPSISCLLVCPGCLYNIFVIVS